MHTHDGISRIAAAIGDPARSRILSTLLDGRRRTSTELATAAGVMPSTASAHLNRLRDEQLVTVHAQGRHRYYALAGADVAAALEALHVIAGANEAWVSSTPQSLRAARTCYDHIAGFLGVSVHDRFVELGWIENYEVTAPGVEEFASIGIDIDAVRAQRRRFAFACIDWSERRPHLAGALGAAVLDLALRRKWVRRDPDSRRLAITAAGEGELLGERPSRAQSTAVPAGDKR